MAEFEKRLPKLGQDYIEKMRLPQKLAFTKMEGIGNDYVYVWFEDLDTPLTDPAPLAIFTSEDVAACQLHQSASEISEQTDSRKRLRRRKTQNPDHSTKNNIFS